MDKFIQSVSDIIWSPALVVLLVCTGLYLSVRTGFVQLRRIGLMFRTLFDFKSKKEGSISSFEAFCIALSGRVGTGNIMGVAAAIAFGGPGAVFWMWLVAFLGASSAFTESTLAQLFKVKHGAAFRGGPAFYIANGLKCKWLAVLFAVVTIIGCGLFATTVQSNGMTRALTNAFGVPSIVGGIILAVLLGLVVIGGATRIARVAGIVTPFMAVGYIVLSIVVVAINWRAVPGAFQSIFEGAFGINPLCGGILGSTIAMGVKRGIFSNEAGQGTGAIPSAAASVDHPAQQGLAQAFSVYVDTLFVCTATALMIITTGMYNVIDQSTGEVLVAYAPELGANFSGYTQSAICSALGPAGGIFVGIAMAFFAFTTTLAYYFYVESSFVFLLEGRNNRWHKVLKYGFCVLYFVSVFFGALKESGVVWTLADIGVGSMAWINVIAILILSPQAVKALKEYEGIMGKRKK